MTPKLTPNNAANQLSRAATSSSPSSSPLRINKDSRAIRKPSNPLGDPCTSSKGPNRKNPNPNKHEPIIIYTQDPEVFHAEPSTFKSVVQTLTGLRQSDDRSNRAKSEVVEKITGDDCSEGKGALLMNEQKEIDSVGCGGLNNMRVVNEQTGNNFLGFFEDENLLSSCFVKNDHTSDVFANVPPSDPASIESYLNVFNSPLGDDFTDFMDTLPDLEPFLFN